MVSLRLLDHMFVSCVSQTRENKRGVKVSMLSSRLLDHVFVSRVSQTRDHKRIVKGSEESMLPFIARLLSLVRLTRYRCEDSMLPFTPRILSLV
jgi:hypothetical protein